MHSTYFFMLAMMQKDSDRQLQERRNAIRIDMLVLQSIRMRRGIDECCSKNYEIGVIVFYVKISFRMCMFLIFVCKCFGFRELTKFFTLNRELARVMLQVAIRVLNYV